MGEIFNTPAERKAWIGDNYKRMLTFLVLYNPRAVYELVKQRYPIFPSWERGTEQTEKAQNDLYTFLVDAAENSGEALRFVVDLAAVVPGNPINDNLWLKKP